MDYKKIAEIANRRRRDALAAEPLLSDDKLRSYTKDLTTLSRDADVFSQLEITIINAEAADIVVKIGEGSWTSLQVTNAFCKAASIAQQLTNCLTEVLFAEARERAQVLDEYLAKTGKTIGPLHGLPISLKDCFITPPHPSSIGIAAFANGNTKPDEESAMAVLLRSLGAVFYVKSNTPVAMMMMETDNNVWGPTCNPYNRGLSPGGSSGGEGALLALRASPLGIGTDIGGSVRIPSAWCNLYGLRPSFGRFPTFGTRSGIPGQEVVMSVNGPMARSLETLKFYSSTVLSPAAAPWKLDPKCVPMPWSSETQIQPASRKLRLAVIGNNDGVVTVHPPVERAIDMTKKALEAAGHDVVDWDLSLHMSLFKSMGAAFLDFGGTAIMPLLEAHDEPVFPSMQAYALAAEAAASGGPILTPDKQRDNNASKWKLQKAHMDAWNAAGIDGIVMAVTPWAAARLGFTIGSQKTHYVGYTGWVNVLDLPSCTFPVTFADKAQDLERTDFKPLNESDKAIQEDYDPDFYDGAPVALQLVGERLQEEKVLEMVGRGGPEKMMHSPNPRISSASHIVTIVNLQVHPPDLLFEANFLDQLRLPGCETTVKMPHPFDIPSDSDAAASEAGYNSDAHQLSKTSGRANKRRKLSFELPTDFAALARKSAKVEVSNADAPARSPSSRFTSARKPGEGADFEDEADNDSNEDAESAGSDSAEEADDHLAVSQGDDIAEHSQKQDSQGDDALDMDGSTESPKQSLKRKRPSLDTLAKTTTATSTPEKKALKTGIIYLPRLPPFLKPTTLRTLLTPYTRHGINRLFLTPEPHAARLNRLKQGGNRKRMFTDGWVEFYSKRDAKLVAEALNGRTMGGKKGGRWRDDIWALRYLRGFKWADLVGERRDEEAERSGRLDAERRREKKERESFIRSVEQGKVEKTRREKEEARRKKAGPEDGATAAEGDEGRKRTFQFRQNAVVRKTAGVEGQAKNGEQGPGANGDVQRVLSKIF